MGVLTISFDRVDKITTNFFSSKLPQAIRFLILVFGVMIIWYRRVTSHYKYMSEINKKSFVFVHKRELKQDLSECTVCLWEIREGEVGRMLRCEHTFQRNCLDQWLRSSIAANCPLCRRAILPREVVAEYQLEQKAAADSGFEKELALVLLSSLHFGSCHHKLPPINYF
ncbi:hypothetical protein CDL12_09486 [Handroanthus impetiginosus]|uniref:RING-type domain-containing protein n=1 Tax=Handroanthus impetiginosus TaxID=429701 RepID=A0A2G9HJZ1_9LAMI|nr:hypothetical protein CDL12_09486 [Handroanthus impetiginosus]